MALETVLVVDEPRAAQKTKSVLSGASYRVLTASTGEQALRILQTTRPVELVLSELTIPDGMSGISLVGKIRVSYAATAVMLMTSSPHPLVDASIPLLIKPFTALTLKERVAQVLADARRSTELLAKTLEANRIALDELTSAKNLVAESVRQSRHQRTRRYCLRLRTTVARPTILVAEDDPALRYSICHHLSQCGFRVLEASDGNEVLNISREHGGHIDVLVTGRNMPDVTGLELVEVLAAERPRIRTVFMTSGSTGLPRQAVRIPLDLDELLTEIVAAILDSEGAKTLGAT